MLRESLLGARGHVSEADASGVGEGANICPLTQSGRGEEGG